MATFSPDYDRYMGNSEHCEKLEMPKIFEYTIYLFYDTIFGFAFFPRESIQFSIAWML